MNEKIDTRAERRETMPIQKMRWQRRLLPFMTGFIVAMAVVFFIFSGIHLYQVTSFIQSEQTQNIRTQIEQQINRTADAPASGSAVVQNSLLLLEADVLDMRYHEASALLLSRIWSRQLALITGMVLAFLGAVFIVGKLSEPPSEISGGSAEWRVAISSASPGIVLSFFGTVLLTASLFVRASLNIVDAPTYLNILRPQAVSGAGAGPLTTENRPSKPLSLHEMQKIEKEDRSNKKAQAPARKDSE